MARPTPHRGVLRALHFLFLLPWRLIALLILAVIVIPGVINMWRLPSLAQSHNLDLSLLTLRAIDQPRAATPLAPLRYQSAVQKHLIDLSPDLDLPEILVREFT